MRKADKRELMIQWFHENFEDPSNKTPVDGGEFIYIWGGPYDARDELYGKFSDLATEELIEEVAQEVENEGITYWAPVHTIDEEDYDLPDAPESPDEFSDERTAAYGTPLDRETRGRVKATLDELQNALDRPVPVGIGHNRPPEKIEPDEVKQLRPAVKELRAEFDSPNPSIAEVKRWAKPIREALVASVKWAGAKLDKAADAAMVAVGTAFGVWLLAELGPYLHAAFNAIIEWLNIVAQVVF